MPKEDEMLEELRKIRKLLEPKPAPPSPEGLWNEFMDFISKYKVLGLAVAFIMGIYLGNLVQALVRDLIMPIVGLAVPGLENLASYKFELNQQVFAIGDFLVHLITFVIVAFVIFLIAKVASRWEIE